MTKQRDRIFLSHYKKHALSIRNIRTRSTIDLVVYKGNGIRINEVETLRTDYDAQTEGADYLQTEKRITIPTQIQAEKKYLETIFPFYNWEEISDVFNFYPNVPNKGEK